MSLRLYLLIIFLCHISLPLYAIPNIMLKDSASSYTNFTVDVFEDTQNKDPTIQEILTTTFSKSISNAFSLGYKNHALWFRFSVTNQAPSSLNMILEMTEMFHNIDIYTVSNQTITHEKNGLQVPIEQRTIPEVNPSFFLNFEKGETKQIYIKLTSDYGFFAAFYLKTPIQFRKDTQRQNNLYIFYFGAIIVIALYNLFIYLYLKEKIYIYYVLYVTSFALWASLYRGIVYNYIDIDTYNLLQLSIPTFFIMLILFSQSALKTKALFPYIHKLLNIFIVLMSISFLWMFISLHNGFYFMNIVVIPILPILLFLAIKASYDGYFIAKIYLLALLIYFVGMCMVTLLALGLYPYSIEVRNAPVVGSFFEVILFSLLLAYRINLLRQEKLISQEKLLTQEHTEKSRLFHMVAEKTMALNKAKEKLEKELEKKKILEQYLKEQASTDSMTGLMNRRAFFDHASKELERSQRYHTDLSCLIIDIDYFKKVNDCYGHHVGDIVIKFVAEEILKNTRSVDIVGRIGGEEFSIMMPDTNNEDAYLMGERIRYKIEKKEIAFDNKIICVTVSIGLCSVNDHKDTDTLQSILQHSDDALYQAKENGRNQIIEYK